MSEIRIYDIVKDATAHFLYYRANKMYYSVEYDGQEYQFDVSLEDIGNATLHREEKAITLMRYIRKSIDAGTFVKVVK